MVSKLRYEEEEEITAGAVACDARSVVVGTSAGGSIRYAYPSLERVDTPPSLFGQRCTGVQFSGDDVILLGNDDGEGGGGPPYDWKHRLCLVSGSTVAQATPLGPGNWYLVKALSGDVAVVYDTTEGQGIAAFDARTGSRRWTQPLWPRRVMSLGEGGLLAAMDPRRVTVIDSATGAVVGAHDLPMVGAATWNCVARAGDHFVLGGSTVPGRDVLFALWQPEKDHIVKSATFPAPRFFPQDLIDYASSFECCAVDIDQVASLRVTRDGAGIVAAVGGDGEFLGAHQSGCAVVFLDAADLAIWSQRLVDEEDGASALLLAPDGAAVVDCCGSVYRVEFAHGAA